MPVLRLLRRRRRRRRSTPAGETRLRRTVVVDLPEAPGSDHRPAALLLPGPDDDGAWQLPTDGEEARELAAFLAVLDVAPPGPVLDVAAGSARHALLAAVYSTRLVRAVEGDAVQAHAARQAAATNALPVVVEEFAVAGVAGTAGESLDAYVLRTALEPAVVRITADDPAAVLAGARQLLGRRRPWLVLTAPRTAGDLLDRLPHLVALSYRVITEMDVQDPTRGYVLAPEAVGTAFWRRLEAWSAALLTAEPVASAGSASAGASVDLRAAEGATSTTT